jgi:type VI protein secretion system component Hcp
MPTGMQSYVEEIVRFFKFKMPGQKSQYYNIHLKGLQIQDVDVRQIIEGIIKDTIQKIAPLYTSLYKIVWD